MIHKMPTVEILSWKLADFLRRGYLQIGCVYWGKQDFFFLQYQFCCNIVYHVMYFTLFAMLELQWQMNQPQPSQLECLYTVVKWILFPPPF